MSMWARREPDGTITVHDVEEHAQFSVQLLEQADNGLTYADGLITISAANGTWTWRETSSDGRTVKATLIDI